MKKAFVVAIAALFVFAFAGTALAATPSVIGGDGASVWTYKDLQDSTAKTEGGYKAFNNTEFTGDYDNPHGGYDTTTDKCNVCHAVHRTEGAYFLLRADTQDDACDYCHIGGSAHSSYIVYDLNAAGKQATNGHTIGAGSTIPDSSIDQWLETITLVTVDENGNQLAESVQVRAYDPAKNEMYRFAKHHGHVAASTGEAGYDRVGPLALSCINCHQPHNAENLVWRPTDFNNPTTRVEGYKLLRLMPSGSVKPGETTNTAGYWDVDDVISVPQETMTPANTGHDVESGSSDPSAPNTIYTAFVGSTQLTLETDRPQTVNQYTLSPWCADCHNLNIGYWKPLTTEELGYKSHADRTHPVPFTGNNDGSGPGQCYSCHRNDMPIGLACNRCHFGPTSYNAYHDDPAVNSDFPHSGQANSIKLLGVWKSDMDDAGNIVDDLTTPVTEDAIDGVCLRCHTGIGVNH
ncbi:MAG: hypothetical protein K6T91_01925 [Firmicutes bacterium]|nr:hypothetical protein [Bacillota bacterium]